MWVREPSIQVCAVECGAKCCREPGYLPVSLEEVTKGDKLFPPKTVFRNMVEGHDGQFFKTEETGHWYLVFADSGGRCPNLAPDNTCSVWLTRPTACREFPKVPQLGCLVSPLDVLGVNSGTATG